MAEFGVSVEHHKSELEAVADIDLPCRTRPSYSRDDGGRLTDVPVLFALSGDPGGVSWASSRASSNAGAISRPLVSFSLELAGGRREGKRVALCERKLCETISTARLGLLCHTNHREEWHPEWRASGWSTPSNCGHHPGLGSLLRRTRIR